MPDSQGTSPLRPTEVGAVQEIVSAASSPLCIVAGGTKTMLGRAVEAGTTVDMTGLSGIVDYEPGELILVARPGTPLAEVEQLLAAQGQHLAFEPPHWGPTATLGGTVACGLSGPRRFKAGALRDFVLGVQIVNGQGGCVRISEPHLWLDSATPSPSMLQRLLAGHWASCDTVRPLLLCGPNEHPRISWRDRRS